MKEQFEITINTHFGKYNPGDLVVVATENGFALDRYWRRIISDAKKNNCVSVKVRGTTHKPRKNTKTTSVKSTTKVGKQDSQSPQKPKKGSQKND